MGPSVITPTWRPPVGHPPVPAASDWPERRTPRLATHLPGERTSPPSHLPSRPISAVQPLHRSSLSYTLPVPGCGVERKFSGWRGEIRDEDGRARDAAAAAAGDLGALRPDPRVRSGNLLRPRPATSSSFGSFWGEICEILRGFWFVWCSYSTRPSTRALRRTGSSPARKSTKVNPLACALVWFDL